MPVEETEELGYGGPEFKYLVIPFANMRSNWVVHEYRAGSSW